MQGLIALAFATLAAAATRPGPLQVAEPHGDTGFAGSAAVFYGRAALVRYEVTTTRTAPANTDLGTTGPSRIQERLTLAPRHGPLQIAVPDRISEDAEIERYNEMEARVRVAHPDADAAVLERLTEQALRQQQPGPYLEGEWALRQFSARVDGEKVSPRHVALRGHFTGWSGAWVVDVPEAARVLEFEYTVDDSCEAASGSGWCGFVFDTSGLCSFEGGPAKYEVRRAVGDLPALHVEVEPLAPPAACARRTVQRRWRFEEGTLTLRGGGAIPASIRTGYWTRPVCPVRGSSDAACVGAAKDQRALEAWFKSLEGGAYDVRSLSLARNQLFARHGRPFQTGWLAKWFAALSWYEADPSYADSRLSASDKAVIQKLDALERAAKRRERGGR